MSDKIGFLKNLYESSDLPSDAKIFDSIIKIAEADGIKTSVRSLKMYKKDYQWKNPNSNTLQEALEKVPPKTRPINILDQVTTEKPIPVDVYNPVIAQEKLTEVMNFLMQGASKLRIWQYYKARGEEITKTDVDRLASEAYNIYATIVPQQRETIMGLNYERLNMLYDLTMKEMVKNPKSTGYLIGKAINIMGEINSMFGIKSLNLNINNTEGIQNKINAMSDEEKFQRLIELKQKADGSYEQ